MPEMLPEQQPKDRFSADQAREAVLAAGRALLRERGLQPGFGNVTFNDAISRSGVPRGSAYRLWSLSDSRKPQDAFWDDLLVTTIASGSTNETETTHAVVDDYLSAQHDLVNNGTPADKAHILRETIRLGAEANIKSLAQSPEWYLQMASLASRSLVPHPNPAIEEAHQEGNKVTTTRFIDLYRELGDLFGLRLRSNYTWEQFSTMAASAACGVSVHWMHNPWVVNIQRATGPDGQMKKWSGFGVLLEGLVFLCFEPIPEADNAADITIWVT